MNIQFATRCPATALKYLKGSYRKNVTEESAKELLSLVAADVVRISDPEMYGKKLQVLPGENYKTKRLDEITRICMEFHESHKELTK